MDSQISVDPQPRVDTLVIDASTGVQRRRTEYAGATWFGGRPAITAFGLVTMSQPAQVQSPFFLPDSLPYRADAAAIALVAITVAIQSAPDGGHQVLEVRAALVADPRNPAVAWVQVQLLAAIRMPTAISYRVDVLVPPDAVLSA